MEIREIKQQLSLVEVVAHYGLQPDRHQRLLCPFHADKTPSLQLYPKTDTFCCFSSNCTAGMGDVIRFIQLMEKYSTHEAIMKAKGLLQTSSRGGGFLQRMTTVEPPLQEADLLEREALMAKVFSYFRKALPVQPVVAAGTVRGIVPGCCCPSSRPYPA